MNVKQIIILIVLTIILAVLFYALLDIIDHHFNVLLILFTACIALTDIFLLARFYFRFMNSPRQKP